MASTSPYTLQPTGNFGASLWSAATSSLSGGSVSPSALTAIGMSLTAMSNANTIATTMEGISAAATSGLCNLMVDLINAENKLLAKIGSALTNAIQTQ